MRKGDHTSVPNLWGRKTHARSRRQRKPTWLKESDGRGGGPGSWKALENTVEVSVLILKAMGSPWRVLRWGLSVPVFIGKILLAEAWGSLTEAAGRGGRVVVRRRVRRWEMMGTWSMMRVVQEREEFSDWRGFIDNDLFSRPSLFIPPPQLACTYSHSFWKMGIWCGS